MLLVKQFGWPVVEANQGRMEYRFSFMAGEGFTVFLVRALSIETTNCFCSFFFSDKSIWTYLVPISCRKKHNTLLARVNTEGCLHLVDRDGLLVGPHLPDSTEHGKLTVEEFHISLQFVLGEGMIEGFKVQLR